MDQPPPPPPRFGVPLFQPRPIAIHPQPIQGPSYCSAYDSFTRRREMEQAAHVSNMALRNTQERNKMLTQKIQSLNQDVELWKSMVAASNAKIEDLKRSLGFSDTYNAMLLKHNEDIKRDCEQKIQNANDKTYMLEQKIQQLQIAANATAEEKRALVLHIHEINATCLQQSTRISELEGHKRIEKELAQQLEAEKTNRAEDKVIIEALKMELEKYTKQGETKVLSGNNDGLEYKDLDAGAGCSSVDKSAIASRPQNSPKRKANLRQEEARKIPKEARNNFKGRGSLQELRHAANSASNSVVETPTDLRTSAARTPENFTLAVTHVSVSQREEVQLSDSDDDTWVIDC